MKKLLLLLVFLAGTAGISTWLTACPFCDAPALMMAEQIQMCDHLVLGKWVGGDKPTETKAGTAKFEVLKVARSLKDRFKPGDKIELPQYIAGTDKTSYALMGPDTELADWHSPQEVSDSSWTYLSEIPPPVTDPAKQTDRLAFAIPYLEHPDLLVSNDAYAEFAAAPYEVIVPLKDKFPRDNLRKWLADPKTSVTRIGLYGLLLGLCGDEADAQFMEKKIVVPDQDFRLGIEGVMSGYILIKGEEGLKVLEDSKFRAKTFRNPAGEEKTLPFSEIYAAMQALRFFWTYEPDRITKVRLKESMRLLLDRPDFADIVIADLSRWKDWEIQDRLVAMYDQEEFNKIPAVKRAIVRFLYYCSQDKPKPAAVTKAATTTGSSESGSSTVAASDSASATVPAHVTKALAHLAELEKKDPKTVIDAKRFLVR